MSDPVDRLLEQAAAYAKRIADARDGSRGPFSADEFDYDLPDATSYEGIASGGHGLVRMRERAGEGQRGMFAKRDIQAGTRLVASRPIVAYWELEGEGDDDSTGGETEGSDAEDDYREGGECDKEDCFFQDADEDGNTDDVTLHNTKKLEDQDEPPSKGKAEEDRQAGAKAVTSNGEDDGESDVDDVSEAAVGTKRNGILVLRALERITDDPSLWEDTLSELFPRDAETALELPPWFCGDPATGLEIEARTSELPSLGLFPDEENEKECEEIALRLPLIVRYNVLSMETCPELFVYPDAKNGGMASLAGTGLYGPEVSYFNHSCVPNVSRYCIGDAMFLVANRDIAEGDELCFSYIEHEFLCESAARRAVLLDMDFGPEDEGDDGDEERPNKRQKTAEAPTDERAEEGSRYPIVDAEMQGELMATPPADRLTLIDELLDTMAAPAHYRSDGHHLRILRAVTLEALGRSGRRRDDAKPGQEHALPDWGKAIDFAVENLPPLDEATVALRVQAALCASVDAFGDRAKAAGKRGRRAGDAVRARHYAERALEMHDALFGGGRDRFLRRYAAEFSNGYSPMRHMSRNQMLSNLRELWGFTDKSLEEMITPR